ncbi:MAG: NAD(P)/FAD-dependent oxidoreductase [Waddliaceae bacterium]
MAYEKVIIIGGGFAGINVAKKLKRAHLEITLIDRRNHHLFQPLLYQVATAALAPRDIAYPIREILKKQKNTTVMMNEVVSINTKAKKVHLSTDIALQYDYLVIAPGSSHSYFGHDEWHTYAPGLKTLSNAIDIREKILLAFEKAEVCDSLQESQKFLRFVIVGGGPTGVELAGAIAEIAHKTMLKNFRRIDTNNTEIYLIEGNSHILKAYPEPLSLKAREYLVDLGVKVLTDTRVQEITSKGVQFGDHFLETENVFWAAGVHASPLLETIGAELDRAGRVLVEPDLSIKDHPNTFVIGDAASVKGEDGSPLPGLAQVAMQQGKYVANLINKRLLPEARKQFVYNDRGSMATIGEARAVAWVKGRQIVGLKAWLLWSVIHVMYLVGFRNRLVVTSEWFFWYLFGQRGSRLIFGSFKKFKEKKEQLLGKKMKMD